MMKTTKAGRDIFTLSIGALIAQLIPIVASLILARIYSMEQFADAGIFISYAGILSIVAMGQYEMAIVRPQEEHEARHIIRLCLGIGLGFMTLSYFVILISKLLSIQYVTSIPCVYLLPVYVFLLGLLQVYLHYSNRSEHYNVIATANVTRSAFQAITRILLGFSRLFHGLIYGAAAGLVAALAYNEKKVPIRHLLRERFKRAEIKKAAAKYRYFPLYLLPSSLLNALSANLPILLLSAYFDKTHIGYFSMTLSLLLIPTQLAGNAISKVFYKKTSVACDEEARRLSWNLFKITFGAGILINLILITCGEFLFAFVLGDAWRTSGTYAILLAPWVLMRLCFSPLSVIFDAKDKQSVEFLFNTVLFVASTVLILTGCAVFNDMNLSILLYSLCGFTVWVMEGWVIFRLTGLKLSARQIFSTLLILVPTLILWGLKVATLWR